MTLLIILSFCLYAVGTNIDTEFDDTSSREVPTIKPSTDNENDPDYYDESTTVAPVQEGEEITGPINESFPDEEILRLALERSFKSFLEQNLNSIQKSPSEKTAKPTTLPLTFTTQFALSVSTTLPTTIEVNDQNTSLTNEHDKNEMLQIIGEDVIGNFDQIIIDQSEDGAIIVTKKRKLFSNNFSPSKNEALTIQKEKPIESKNQSPLLLKIAPDQTEASLKNEKQSLDETKNKSIDTEAFIKNEQLITICLAALGVTSTGLLMWIAIQHLYGIYTDFKKTINPIQYYDANNSNADFECDDSVVSARMADRPPTYAASQRQNYENVQINRSPIMSPRVPPVINLYRSPEISRVHPETARSYMSSHASMYSETTPEVSSPTINIRAETQSVASSQTPLSSHRRIARFVERRRTNSESNNQVVVYQHKRSLAASMQSSSSSLESVQTVEPVPMTSLESQLRQHPGPSCLNDDFEQIDEHEFDSAPELADMDLIHKILKRTKTKNTPARTASFTTVGKQLSPDGAVYLNVQITIDNPQPKIEEISDTKSNTYVDCEF